MKQLFAAHFSPLSKIRKHLAVLSALLLCCSAAKADSIDYLAANFSAQAEFNGNSGNLTFTTPFQPGETFGFKLEYRIVGKNTATYPKKVTFGLTPGSADVQVNGLGEGIFESVGSSLVADITITAPAREGNYHIKIMGWDENATGRNELSSGGGIQVSFSVAAPSAKIPTVLTMSSVEPAIYRQPEVIVGATLLTESGSPLQGQTINFALQGKPVGSAITGVNGFASMNVPTATLSVGDHALTADFAGTDEYLLSGGNANLGVKYIFIGFQQPINADGSSVFGGRVIPVKIRIADFYTKPVAVAVANVFVAHVSASTVGNEQEAVAVNAPDSGNGMRYDASADQYIFNWDTNGLANGSYSVRVGLGEGSSGDVHSVLLSIKRKGK